MLFRSGSATVCGDRAHAASGSSSAHVIRARSTKRTQRKLICSLFVRRSAVKLEGRGATPSYSSSCNSRRASSISASSRTTRLRSDDSPIHDGGILVAAKMMSQITSDVTM